MCEDGRVWRLLVCVRVGGTGVLVVFVREGTSVSV